MDDRALASEVLEEAREQRPPGVRVVRAGHELEVLGRTVLALDVDRVLQRHHLEGARVRDHREGAAEGLEVEVAHGTLEPVDPAGEVIEDDALARLGRLPGVEPDLVRPPV